jgi:DNA polymerase-3 subunit alpha
MGGGAVIHLHVRTEYSFRRAYGKVEDVLKHAVGGAMAMTDSGTWGHVNWMKACKKAGVKPIYGVEVALVPNLAHREKSGQSTGFVVLLAKNDNGLRELYRITSDANANFYHVPRIEPREHAQGPTLLDVDSRQPRLEPTVHGQSRLPQGGRVR